MRYMPPVGDDLREQRMCSPVWKMDREANAARHHDQVGKDACAPKQNIPVAGNELGRAKGRREGLHRQVELDQIGWPIPQNSGPITSAARMTLVNSRELPSAIGALPG